MTIIDSNRPHADNAILKASRILTPMEPTNLSTHGKVRALFIYPVTSFFSVASETMFSFSFSSESTDFSVSEEIVLSKYMTEALK